MNDIPANAHYQIVGRDGSKYLLRNVDEIEWGRVLDAESGVLNPEKSYLGLLIQGTFDDYEGDQGILDQLLKGVKHRDDRRMMDEMERKWWIAGH